MSGRKVKDPVPLASATLDHPTQGALGDPASGVQVKVNNTADAQKAEREGAVHGANTAVNVALDEIETPDLNAEAKPPCAP